MKKTNILFICIVFILFIIPFFWIPQGFTDLGGDSGRLYFLDPLSVTKTLYEQQTPRGILLFSFIPYQLVLYLLNQFIHSPTILIAIEHGLQLSLAFVFIVLSVKRLLTSGNEEDKAVIEWASILGGIAYVGFMTKTGWVTSLETFNQIFLNPLMFYLLLEYFLSRKIRYIFAILFVTLLYSGNFGFSAAPQLFSFYPFILPFLCLYVFFIAHKKIPWKGLFILICAYIGIHAFHILPTLISMLETSGSVNNQIFSKTSIEQSGLHYFDVNRQNFGKLGASLFQPSNWDSHSIFVFFIPLLIVLSFIKERSKLSVLTGYFFAVTFFLVSANITLLGVRFYRQLFHIPGFLMFRSFYEKWYYTYTFFLALLFTFALYYLFKGRKKVLLICAFLFISIGIIYRVAPFIRGEQYTVSIYQSEQVQQVFDVDPDLIDTLDYIKLLPDDGKILTLPLTASYFQVIHGDTSGAYIGVSTVNQIAGKKDIPGYWKFEQYSDDIIGAIQTHNTKALLQYISLFNIRYIFSNNDPRILTKFPQHPYEPSMLGFNSSAESNEYITNFLKEVGVAPQYEKGVFSIGKLPDQLIRPNVFIPDIIYESKEHMLEGTSMRSSFMDASTCQMYDFCNVVQSIPSFTFHAQSPSKYTFTVDTTNQHEPFIIILSEPFSNFWKMSLDNASKNAVKHIVINEYANGWIIDSTKIPANTLLSGTITMQFTKYVTIGTIISFLFIIVIILYGLFILKRTYEKKK